MTNIVELAIAYFAHLALITAHYPLMGRPEYLKIYVPDKISASYPYT